MFGGRAEGEGEPRFDGACASSPAVDRLKPARNAGTSITAISTPASSARFAKGWLWRHESGSTSNSPTPAPSFSPDEMPNLMPDKGWRRHFEEPIPLPDEMATKAAQGYYHDFLSPLDLPELELDASDSGRGAS